MSSEQKKAPLAETLHERDTCRGTLVSEQFEANQSLIEKIASLEAQKACFLKSLADKELQIDKKRQANRDLRGRLASMGAHFESLSGQVQGAITAPADATTADADAATIAVDAQAILTARVAELTEQLKRSGHQSPSLEEIPESPIVPALLPPSRRRAKFVVFSNPRSASTWLETMLGVLPD